MSQDIIFCIQDSHVSFNFSLVKIINKTISKTEKLHNTSLI